MRHLTFATQGDQFSYHALAAEMAAGEAVAIDPCDNFAQVVARSRSEEPGLGVIAVNNTLSGVVENAAHQLVRFRPSELPPIVARVDLGISLALLGSSEQSLTDLNRSGVRCLAQDPALSQCRDFMKEHLPLVKPVIAEESVKAVREMLEADSEDVVAIGPSFAATGLGAVMLREQLNPVGHKTSFFVLQRDPTQPLLPEPVEGHKSVTVTSVGFPEQAGEKEKVIQVAIDMRLPMVRIIDFAQGDFTRDADLKKRGGGIFDIGVGPYAPLRYEFCKRVNQLKTNEGRTGPFTAKVLGSYHWPSAYAIG